ncbi:MAG: histidine phosphatase family protein [Inquilinus sp.]|nr:histidine phosphatase family protein [Inquilinus sp.]
MKTLYLLRHAKSDWSLPGQDDHDRALAPRGERAALVIGRYIARCDPPPDAILCSSAVRARRTLDLAASQWPETPPIEIDRRLYLAGAGGILARLAKVADAVDSLMVVGHNPDMQALAMHLAKDGPTDLLSALASKFPTAALAAITLPLEHWRDIGTASGTLTDFATPKTLV